MKRLFNKFNKTKFSVRLVYLFVMIAFLVSYVLLFLSVMKLTGVETILRITILVILGIFLLLYIFGDLLMLLSKKNKSVLITSFLVVILSSFCLIGSFVVNRFYSLLDGMKKSKVVYTTNMITLKDTVFSNNKDFVVGLINNEKDVEGNILAYDLIKEKNLDVTVKKYDTYFELLEKLYNKELNGIFITNNYVVMYEGYEAYEDIDEDVKVEFELSKEMENQDVVKTSSGSVDKPFTVLLMGVDSTSDTLNANAAFNGDTLMLITFNPHTLSATVFSIPRDTYVPIACLKNKESSKINSSAAYGSQCVINTIQDLVDIDIDYYVKINFKGVVDLVDALKGIDITVPKGIKFCEQNSKRSFADEDLICLSSGEQHMNGEQALAFARHRKTLPLGDFQRVQHQQLVVEGIANSAKNLSSINDFGNVLDAISMNIDTNMSTSEMLNLYNVGKDLLLNSSKGNALLNIQKTYLTGYDLTMYVNNLRSRVYTFQYFEQSLEEIKNAMKINLEKQKPEIIKTFNFSINETYEVPIIGKKYYSVKKNETIPKFEGESLSYVKTWCEARNISVNVSYITPNDEGYSQTMLDGTVIGQDVLRGKLVKDVKSITVKVIKHPVVSTTSTTTTTTKEVDTTTEASTTASTTTKPIDEPIEELVE